MTFGWTFICGLLSVVIIDLVLAGDNAVVIAMAVKSLPKEQRRKGIILGAGAAVVMRVVFTFFVAQILQIGFLKLTGGVLIAWIAVKLFVGGVSDDSSPKEVGNISQAVKFIVIADLSMSLDNMLAVGGASGGNLFLLIFGLSLSIPLVVFTSNLIANLMDRYPVIIYIGAAILGRVAGEMIFTDPFLARWFMPSPLMIYLAEAMFALGVIATGRFLIKRNQREKAV